MSDESVDSGENGMLDKTTDPGKSFGFSDNPEEAWTLPAETYFDVGWYGQEQQSIFQHHWRYAAHISEIPEPGDYVTLQIGTQPVVILRTADGSIRAFHNVCKHRAHLLFPDERGHNPGKLITCPYHAWAYDYQGALKAAPYCDQITGFDKSEFTLNQLVVEQLHGLLFVNINPAAPSIELDCGHYFHYDCTRRRLRERWPTPQITFGFCECPLCKTKIYHELLLEELNPIFALHREIELK